MDIKYLNYNNKTIPYVIIKKDNKNTYFRFKDKYLEISKSKYVSNESITNFILTNFDKFYHKYLDHAQKYPNEFEIILEDIKYKLNVVNENTKLNFKIDNNELTVKTKLTDITKIKKKIYEYHLIEMYNRIKDDVGEILQKNNIEKLPIKTGYYKSKFGSYHRKHNEITLNIVLAKANINYLYYVIMHEYAHTIAFDHSKKFYNALEKLMPNYKYYDKSIKTISIWL